MMKKVLMIAFFSSSLCGMMPDFRVTLEHAALREEGYKACCVNRKQLLKQWGKKPAANQYRLWAHEAWRKFGMLPDEMDRYVVNEAHEELVIDGNQDFAAFATPLGMFLSTSKMRNYSKQVQKIYVAHEAAHVFFGDTVRVHDYTKQATTRAAIAMAGPVAGSLASLYWMKSNELSLVEMLAVFFGGLIINGAPLTISFLAIQDAQRAALEKNNIRKQEARAHIAAVLATQRLNSRNAELSSIHEEGAIFEDDGIYLTSHGEEAMLKKLVDLRARKQVTDVALLQELMYPER